MGFMLYGKKDQIVCVFTNLKMNVHLYLLDAKLQKGEQGWIQEFLQLQHINNDSSLERLLY